MTTLLAGTWDDGVNILTSAGIRKEHSGQSVAGLAADGAGGVLALIDGRTLCRRNPAGDWHTLATSKLGLVCCVAIGSAIYVGTDNAQILALRGQALERLEGFDRVAGREQWYAGTVLLDGQLVGPPLGIRSMTATSSGTILANVHVGGLPRSLDRGATWQPTIDIEADVHQVCAHPARPDIVIAASASGLCISRDAGSTWRIDSQGMHNSYCSAVGFVGHDIYVSSSDGPFDKQSAVYRRRLDEDSPLQQAGGGLPQWFQGRVDTDNIAASGSMAAIADGAGNIYVSDDAGRTWSHREQLDPPSALCIY